MKATLSLLVVGLVAASAIQIKNVKPYEFTPGKTYLYDYSAQLLTGIPKIADQFSGLKMKAQIAFQAKSSSQEVLMKLTNIKMSQAQNLKNAEYGFNVESEISGEQKMSGSWMKEYIRELEKSISFTHLNGEIVNFVSDKNEPEWSLNIKKSILSLFHLNLSPKQVMRSTEENKISRPVNHEDLTYYGVYESGMAGVCETVYELNQVPDFRADEPNRDLVLNVTKTKNYHNCLTKSTFGMKDNLSSRHSQQYKPSYVSVNRGYYPVPSREGSQYQPSTPVKQYTSTKYNISLAHQSAQIEGIWSEGKIVYTTFGENIMAYTHQKVTLVKVYPSREISVERFTNPQTHQDLSYQLPKMNEAYTKIAMDIPTMAPFTQQETTDLINNLPKLFENLAQAILNNGKASSNTNNKDAMQKVVQIVNALSALSRADLEDMYRQIAQAGYEKTSTEKDQLTRKMFLDALALTGSNEAAELIAQMILNQQVTGHEAREMLAALPRNMNLPTTQTLDAYKALLVHQRVASEPLMYSAVAVCFGKMVNTAYIKSNQIQKNQALKAGIAGANEKDIEVGRNANKNNQWAQLAEKAALSQSELERYISVAASILENADSFTKKVAAIECLAHMGHKDVLKYLEPYITGSGSIEVVPGYEVEDQKDLIKERNYLRTIAIYSLAHVARKNAKQVLPLVLPVYRNAAEPHEMRLAAFTIAMLCRPEQHILESIASDLYRESDKHVTSFVVSALNSIGNLTTPCQKSLARAAAQAAESAPKQSKRSKYSTYLSGDFYDEKRSFGMWSAAELIKSRNSPIPRAGYVAVSQISSPFHDDFLEIGFEAKGLEQIAKRIIGSNGLIASLLEKKNTQRNTLKHSREQINESIRKSHLRESAKLNLFVKMFEQTSIYPLDEAMINDAVEQVEQWAREAIEQGFTGTFVKVLMPSSISKISASEIGLPVVVAHKHPLVVSLKVNKLNVEKRQQSNGSYKGFTVSAEIEPKIMYSSYAFVYGIEPVSKTTIGTHVEKTYHASLPLKLTLTHEHEQSQWKFVAKPKSGHEAVYHKSEAQTFLSKAKIVYSPTLDWLQTAQTIRKMNSSPVKVEKTISHPRIPVAAKVIVETEESELNRRVIQKQIAKQGLIPTFIQIFRNSGLNTREVRVNIEDNAESQERELRFKWTMDAQAEYNDESDEDKTEEQQRLEERIQEDDEENLVDEESRENRDSVFEDVLARIGSAIAGRKVHPRESERQIQKEAKKLYLQARKNLRWIDQDKHLTAEQEQEQEYQDNYRHKYAQIAQRRSNNGQQYLRTHFIHRENRVCFSTQPIVACADDARPTSTKLTNMDFHCLPRSSPLTQQLMKDAERSVLRQLVNKRVDFNQELTVPVSCSA